MWPFFQEHDRAEFQRLVAQRARPSCVLGEVQLRQLGQQLPATQSRSVLGQIHLEMARCHQTGRFGAEEDEEGDYDQEAAVFHLEQAAQCGALEALLELARAHLGMPHDLLPDWSPPVRATRAIATRAGLHPSPSVATRVNRIAPRLVHLFLVLSA